jgi:hypothetical protein
MTCVALRFDMRPSIGSIGASFQFASAGDRREATAIATDLRFDVRF